MGKPKCILEVVNPDDVLVVGINNKWYRTFTSSSDRYPLKIEIPPLFLNEQWNLISGGYTNDAKHEKNYAKVEYKVLLDNSEVVHVVYTTEVQPETFSITFKDTFSLHARKVEKGVSGDTKRRNRFNDLMAWQRDTPPPLPEDAEGQAEAEDEGQEPPPGPPSGRRIGG
jgi:hypothetical protein